MANLQPTTINGETYLYNSITAAKQNNTITIPAKSTYVDENILININVTKAILSTTSGSNSFDIQVPNGKIDNVQQWIDFHFEVDEYGNTTVTEGTVS